MLFKAHHLICCWKKMLWKQLPTTTFHLVWPAKHGIPYGILVTLTTTNKFPAFFWPLLAKIGFSHDKFLNVTEHFNGFCSSRIRLDTFLGSGGMGNVFLAHADAENRMVAVKVAKDGLGLPSVQTRFLNERQILLQTDSPGIVTLLGSGTTDQGIPFLVLEWINGSSIDQYCREFNPSLQSKGNLFGTTYKALIGFSPNAPA